jgi:hypothetical protein
MEVQPTAEEIKNSTVEIKVYPYGIQPSYRLLGSFLDLCREITRKREGNNMHIELYFERFRIVYVFNYPLPQEKQ